MSNEKFFNVSRYHKTHINYMVKRLRDFDYVVQDLKVDFNGNFYLIIEHNNKLLNYCCNSLHQCYEVLDNLLYLKVKENSKKIMKDFYMERESFNKNIISTCKTI